MSQKRDESPLTEMQQTLSSVSNQRKTTEIKKKLTHIPQKKEAMKKSFCSSFVPKLGTHWVSCIILYFSAI